MRREGGNEGLECLFFLFIASSAGGSGCGGSFLVCQAVFAAPLVVVFVGGLRYRGGVRVAGAWLVCVVLRPALVHFGVVLLAAAGSVCRIGKRIAPIYEGGYDRIAFLVDMSGCYIGTTATLAQ